MNLLSLANNHLLDYGPLAMSGTIELLDGAGINHAGAGQNEAQARRPVFLMVNDVRVAFLSYCSMPPAAYGASAERAGTAFCAGETILEDIRAAKKRADCVIVAMHWGKDFIAITPRRNRRLGRACIDAGATLVLGHHPHVLQGFEVYKRGLIAYSLGNFIFGNIRKPDKSAILQVELDTSGIASARIYPIKLHVRDAPHQPYAPAGKEADAILRHLQKLSEPFATKIRVEDGVGVIVP